ncbi:hypothetical protein Cni_G10663 [Canna indica]|uniref:Uncharacterized protein n=1 Tax=Canna indica TaxID=4628 RepID=A0AAQ3K4Q6_9LILI|nr:hypothetical protein Cni_G10663 [Canna indica]
MSSGCKSSVICTDAHRPVRPTYVNLYKWPESDAEFVKSMTEGKREERGSFHSLVIGSDGNLDDRRKWRPSPRVVDSYSCRQMYLRSYPFSKEEPAGGKARQFLAKAKQRAAVIFPFLYHKTENHRSCVATHTDTKMSSLGRMTKEKKRKVKGCGTSRKLIKELSYSGLFSMFYRFISCTASVEVADRR